MPVPSASAFLEVLEKSRLTSADQLQKLRDAERQFPDAKAIAVHLVKEGVLTRWQAGALLAGNHNLWVGKYQLQSQLGSGKTGRVYLARHGEMGRQVALKILPRRADASATNLQQFMRQARAVSALDHPHLIHTFDVDSEAEQFYLVMEYFPGEDLQSLVAAQGPLAPSQAADLVRQAAEGLAHAAEKGLTHGDIRPSSIAVDRLGRVKLLHLGVIELAGPAIKMLDPMDPSTADYAAPELEDRKATPLTDIYSLGCVLYFLLTGKTPFGEGEFEGRRRAHRAVPPAPIASHRPDAPADLVEICQKMMAKSPEDRYGSAQEVAAALADWLRHNQPSPPPREPAREERPRPAEAMADSAVSPPAPPALAPSAPPAAPEIPSFDFTKKKSARKTVAPAPPAKSAAPPKPETKKKAAKSRAKAPWDQRWLIGLGIGGVVVLAAILGAAVMFLGGDEEDASHVAQTTAREKTPAQPQVIDGNVLEEETLDGDLFSASTDEAPLPATASAEPPANEPTKAASTDAAAGAVNPPAPAQPVAEGGGVAPSAASADTIPVSAPATAVVQAEPQPPAPPQEAASPLANEAPVASPPSSEAPPPEAAAANPEPPPAEAPAPAEKQPPADPFAQFTSDAVSLPALESGAASAPQKVAVVHDDPDAGCFLRLTGGEVAYRGREVFTLEPDGEGFRNRAWTVFLGRGESAAENRIAVAKWSLDEQDNLNFQWTPEAATQEIANYLRNCLLEITIGDRTKQAALREPSIVEPITLSLERGSAREQYDLDWPPEETPLQLQITSLEGPFPKHTLDAQSLIKANGGKTAILFGEAPNQLLALQVTSSLSRKLTVAMVPFIKIGNESVRFNLKQLQQVAAAAGAQYQEWNAAVTAKLGPEEVRKQVELVLPQQQALAAAYADLLQKAQELKDGKVHFRVFFTIGERQVEVLKTAAAAPAEEAPATQEADRAK